ncbi:DUF1697 domain-containing protein [Paracidobacterium acidisoli]|uniref:DUF1697 domain-containing protein n=1 Tax=Paracidobacterium acidisoli TaxID=2303751 RepID=UPI001314284A|nr:DUF1697 domain-containing protein [Paracidobacterium acidisoli]
MALLRGVNVGGKNKLPMADLAAIFADIGCCHVSTYIQSGNVLFSAPSTLLKKIAKLVQDRIATRFGIQVPIVIRSSEQLADTLRANPFLKMGKAEATLHVYFLADKPGTDAVNGLDAARSTPDEFRVIHQEIFLYLPNGMARTKLTNAWFDSKLKTVSTARSWATVNKLLALMQA